MHGDLTGNVLFDRDLPPLVIDLSPYWRPPTFATAVVMADALVLQGVGEKMVEPLLQDRALPQCLLRALIFRAVADHLTRPRLQYDPYRAAAKIATRLAGA